VFKSYTAFKKSKNVFKLPIKIPGIFNEEKVKLYESNLAPMLRCFHIRKISGCSWVSTDKYNKMR
jgi:hypothetical protein